jgi:tetratricopeptide (TPR) repeat protein
VAPLDVSLLPSHGEQAAKEIRAAMRAGKPDVALDGFRATGLSAAPSLSFDELLWLGQTAAQHIDFESAELAFRQAVERKAPAEALSRARVMFARLLDEKLGRREDARRWMERIVAEHAGTPGATFAQQWLERGVP